MVNFGAEGDEYSILPADSDGVGRADSNGTDFCTVIESIGRNKKALAPDIIFRGKELHKDRFSSDVRGNWVFHLSYEGGSYQCYRKKFSHVDYNTPFSERDKAIFLCTYKDVKDNTFLSAVIKEGWEKLFLQPFCPEQVLNLKCIKGWPNDGSIELDTSHLVEEDKTYHSTGGEPMLVEFLQDDFNFELVLRLLDNLKLQAKVRQLKAPLRYKQLIANLFTKYVLNRALDKPQFEDLALKYSNYGKPSIEGLEFNTSTSNDIIAIAVHTSPIGMDLSHAVQNVSSKDYRIQFEPMFHKFELSQLDSYFKFNHFWTLKEAFTKLIGSGLNVELADFYFTMGPDEEFIEDNYCVIKCHSGSGELIVKWYDQIATNAEKLFQKKNEFVNSLTNEFYCYSTVIERARDGRLPVICSLVTQEQIAKIKTFEVDFLAVLQRQLQS
ncbi:hypothetical protein K4G61_g2671 [Candida parapsilosis]|nr:hypothetical protein K4G61_g2671 [Candida parapsilosis]